MPRAKQDEEEKCEGILFLNSDFISVVSPKPHQKPDSTSNQPSEAAISAEQRPG